MHEAPHLARAILLVPRRTLPCDHTFSIHDEPYIFFFSVVISSEDSLRCSLFPSLRIDGSLATTKYLDKHH